GCQPRPTALTAYNSPIFKGNYVVSARRLLPILQSSQRICSPAQCCPTTDTEANMSSASNIIDLAAYRNQDTRELIDDISARAFLFLRDEAEAEQVPMHAVIAEH